MREGHKYDANNNEDLILAIQSAGVSNGRNGFFAGKALRDDRKDKSGENSQSPK